MAGLLVLILAIGLFLPFGITISDFLVGDEPFFKADWGIPQFLDGVQNRLNWELTGEPFTSKLSRNNTSWTIEI